MIKYIFAFQCLSLVAQVNGNTPDYYVYVEDGKQGVKDGNQDIIIPAQYERVGWSDSGFTFWQGVTGFREDGKWGLLNLDNKIVLEPEYNSLSITNSGVNIIVSVFDASSGKDLFGIIDPSGEQIIPFRYARLEVVNQRILAWLALNYNSSRVGLLDITGKQIIPHDYINLRSVGSLRFLAERVDKLFELFKDDGTRVLEMQFDSLSSFVNQYATVWKGHKAGLIDLQGNLVVAPNYKELRILTSGIEARDFDSWIELNIDNEQQSQYQYDKLIRVQDSVFQVSANSKYWLINPSEEILGEVVLDEIHPFDDGLALARLNKKWGVLKIDGTWLITPRYKNIERSNGFFNTIDQRDRWRVFDKYGIEKTQGFYDEIGEYHKLHFPVRKGDFWGLINRTGDLVVNCVFDSLGKINSDLISVEFKSLYGIIDKVGNWIVIPDAFPKVIIDDQLYFELHGGQSILKKYNGEIVYFTENEIQLFDNYFIERLSNGKVWKVNFSGVIQSKEVVDIIHKEPILFSEFEDIFLPSEGFIGIKKDGKYGFVDDQNRLRIANRYDSIKSYHEDFAAIKLRGKWGFIDKEENIRIQPVYDFVDRFYGDICVVRQGEKYYLLNKEGKLLFTSGFDEMQLVNDNRYLVRKENQYGLVAKNGRMLVNFIYDKVKDLNNGSVIIQKLDKYGVVDLEGVNVIPRVYDDLNFDNTKEHFFGKISSNWMPIKTIN